jgi:hypothetical protein
MVKKSDCRIVYNDLEQTCESLTELLLIEKCQRPKSDDGARLVMGCDGINRPVGCSTETP